MQFLRKNHYSFILFVALVLTGFLVTACDSPLSLGGKINTEVPKIRIPADPDGRSQPGSFLEGEENRILLDIEQEFGIDYVFMTIEYELLDETGKPSGIWTPEPVVVRADLDKSTGLYYVNIDTIALNMADGQFKAQVTAVDVSGKRTTTTDMIYVVKNLPPQIELTIPAIRGVNFDNVEFLENLISEDPVFVGFDLMGLATDNMGIMPGYPKIMIWPRGEALDSNGEPLNPEYRVWRQTVLPRTPGTDDPALTATRFTWPMVKIEDPLGSGIYRWPVDGEPKTGQSYTYLDAGQYQFRIWTMDIYGKPNYYPNRTDNERGHNATRLAPDTHELKYMEIDYIVADIPIVTIREHPMYFNGLDPFDIKVDVTTSNNLDSMAGFVRYRISEDNIVEEWQSRTYDAILVGKTENTYHYELTITGAMAALWPNPHDGIATVHFSAKDEFERLSPPTNSRFTYDKDPPVVSFDRPMAMQEPPKYQGNLEGGSYAIYYPEPAIRWFVGQVTVGGSSEDLPAGVKEVWYHIGKLGDDSNLLSNAQREQLYRNAPWKNTNLHTTTPEAGWAGIVNAWTYTENFNNYRENPDQRDLVQIDTDLGYSTSDPNYGTTNPNYNGEDHSGRFYLPFYVKVIDNAGNQRVVHYKLCIDPNLDIPHVTINFPALDEKGDPPLLGGEVRLSGIASDNIRIHSVQIRIHKAGVPYMPPGAAAPVYPAGYTGDTSNWFLANKIGDDMVVGWSYNINRNGDLNPPAGEDEVAVKIEVRAVDTRDQTGPNPLANNHVGPVEELDVRFSSKVPTITTPLIQKYGADESELHFDGIRMAGRFTITFDVGDSAGINDLSARISRTEGSDGYTDLIVNGVVQSSYGWTITTVSSSSPAEYKVEFDIDSTSSAYYPYGRSGYLYLDVFAENTNENKFQTRRSFITGVDNYYPEFQITTPDNALGDKFLIQGTAKDYGANPQTVEGLERVLVYFEKAQIVYNGATRTVEGTGDYLNPRGKYIAKNNSDPDAEGDGFYAGKPVYTTEYNWHNSIPPMVTRTNVRDMTLPGFDAGSFVPNAASFANFPLLVSIDKTAAIGGRVWESPHAMVIDAQEMGDTVDLDEDGTHGEIWSGLVDKDWGARMDTTKFDDGPLVVHYIVMDQAGNATHYQKDIYIENNKPWIQYINVGTDIDSDGTVAPWTSSSAPGEFRQYPEIIGTLPTGNRKIEFAGPSFRVRNDRFAIKLETSDGNTGKHYRVSYVKAGTPISASAMQRGKVYTISGGVTDWTKYGAPINGADITFVATGPGDGTGIVIPYTEVDFITDSFPAGADDINILLDDFTNIDDSLKDANGDITVLSDRLFIVKVYDSTVDSVIGLTDPPEADQLAHAVLIAVDIDNDDSKRPTILINPFHWNNASDNSLYDNQRTNGHIEFEADLPSQFTDGGTGLLDIDPKVSGRISVRGTLTDNNTIGEISFTFTDFNDGNPVTAVKFNPTGSPKWDEKGDIGTDGWEFHIERNANGTLRETHDQAGHAIDWRLDIDTARLVSNNTFTTVAATDRILKVTAEDRASNTSADSDAQTTSENKTPYYRMDVVPYISAIETPYSVLGGLGADYIRSADGKYSIIQGDEPTFITVRGFNLNPTAVDHVRILDSRIHLPSHEANPASGPTLGNAIAHSVVAADRTSILLGNNSTSGYLTVWSNDIPSLNNINNKDSLGSFIKVTSGANASNGYNEENMPNREADRYITRNITLTNTRYLQFYRVIETDVVNGYNPVMMMDGNNPVFGYLDFSGGDSGTPDLGPNTFAGNYYEDHAMPQRTRFDFEDGTRMDTEYLIKASIWDAMGMTRDDSGRYVHATTYNRSGANFHVIYDRYAELYNSSNLGTGVGWGYGTVYQNLNADRAASVTNSRTSVPIPPSSNVNIWNSNMANDANNNAIPLETVNFGGLLLDRYMYPKLIAKGNSYTTTGAAYYLAYFDNLTKDVIYRNFRIRQAADNVSAPGTAPAGYTNRLSVIGADAEGRPYLGTYTNAPNRNTEDNPDIDDSRIQVVGSASRYFDMAVTSTNIVVVVFYNDTDGQLYIRYSSVPLDGSDIFPTVTWINSLANTAMPMNTGRYVSMAIDDDDKLHIAAFEGGSNNALKYIFVEDFAAATTAAAGVRSVTVDFYGTVGYWTDIKLYNDGPSAPPTPYISYFNMAVNGSNESIKVAWSKNEISSPADVLGGVDANGYTTGNWEFRTVPSINPPQGGSDKFQKVNLDFMTDGKPILGYLANNIEFSYPIGE
ncbi:MAG: hypothetical protein FWG99_08365 [Treponema sp.]|nr:hypothetical protein [Treponema sp.]